VPSLSSPNNCAGFVHNGLVIGTARFRHDPSTTITEIAVRNRKAVVKALEPEEIEKSLCVIREMTKRGQNLHVCEPLEKSYLVANWTGAWKELDFSAVAIGEGRARKTGAFVVGQGLQHNTPHRCELPPSPRSVMTVKSAKMTS
jgi:hypothetical protein